MVSSTLGSPTKTCWKRRSSAGSFSIRSRYSSSVVAPIMCSSPRASIGLSMLPASIAESPPAPAPTTVCSSSMKVMTCPPASLISSRTALSRSSNSPRYFAPATIAARSRLSTRRPLRQSGTSPSTTRWARPSTTAVLPTPGSPMRTGLFLVRRTRTWITRRISASRPMTGSRRPSSAAWVRSTEYFSSDSYDDSASWLVTRRLPRTAVSPSRIPASVRPASVRSFRRRHSTVADRDEQVLGGDVVVLHAGGEVERLASTRVSDGARGGLLDGRPAGPGQRLHRLLGAGGEGSGVDPGLADQVARGAVLLAEQGDEQVDGLGLGVARRGRGELCGLDDLAAAGGELLGAELAQLRLSSLVMWGPLWSHSFQRARS